MSKQVHRIYLTLLFSLGIGTAAVVGINGFTYYTSSQERLSNQRADLDAKISNIEVELELMQEGLGSMGKTREELLVEKKRLEKDALYWSNWKPAGLYGHGLGIIGSAMMIIGVASYSSRKRIRRLRFAGKIKYWLEFHIFLCLLGPTLVLYHTTFKFGGIVSVAAWSMIFVALSGLLGRYIYTQIPRTIEGNELTVEDLAKENRRMQEKLRRAYNLDDDTMEMINHISEVATDQSHPSVLKAIGSLLVDDIRRRSRIGKVKHHLRKTNIPGEHIKEIISIARAKSLLMRRIAFLDTARSIFHYWHVVHFPFSIIMFLILAVHVIVTVSLGYTWIF
ncbi:MAG: hypothetical protein GXO82_05130 [Chlorobi bacterium]|nr:hypothetical protein [Chlorobiota bacterium]